jgi:hypothetical protein
MLYCLATYSAQTFLFVECELVSASVECHLNIEVRICEYIKPLLSYMTVTLVSNCDTLIPCLDTESSTVLRTEFGVETARCFPFVFLVVFI